MNKKVLFYLPTPFTVASGILVWLAMPDQPLPWLAGIFCIAPLLYDLNRDRSLKYTVIQCLWFQTLTAFSAFSWIFVGIETLWQKDRLFAFLVYYLLVPVATTYVTAWGIFRFFARKYLGNVFIAVLVSAIFFALLDHLFSFQNVMFANLVYSAPFFLSFARYGGAILLTLLVLLFSEALATLFAKALPLRIKTGIVALMAITLIAGFVLNENHVRIARRGKTLSTVLVGSNYQPKNLISHYMYQETKDYKLAEDFTALLKSHRDEFRKAEVIVLPESIMPVYYLDPKTDIEKKLKAEFEQLVRELPGKLFVYGGFTFTDEKKISNKIFFSHAENGQFKTAAFNKQILMPFGEVIPGSQNFPFLEKVFFQERVGDPGRQSPFVQMGGLNIGGLICNEAFHGHLYARAKRLGANFISIIGSESWVAGTRAHELLMSSTVLRAVESGMPVIKAANGGLSYIVNSGGEILYLEGPRAGNFRTVQFLLGSPEDTFYSRNPNFMTILFMLITVIAVTVMVIRKKKLE